MGIYREWSDRRDSLNGGLEPIGLWAMRQLALDREHYAEVEAKHKRDIESMDNMLQYWKRQTETAREESERPKTGNSDLANAYRLERNAARAELAYERRQLEQANSSVVANQNLAADRYMEINALKTELDEALTERADARQAAEEWADKYRDQKANYLKAINERNAARADLEVMRKTYHRPTGRIEAIEARVSNLEAQSNAKQADEALDSLRFAR